MACPQEFPEYEDLTGPAGQSFAQLDAWGKVFRANSLGRLPRNLEVRGPPDFVRRLGYGFSVFKLGEVPVQPHTIPVMAKTMARELAATYPRGTMVQLVQKNRQHVPIYEQPNDVPTLFLMVWAGCTDDQTKEAVAEVESQLELMQAMRAKLERDYKEELEQEVAQMEDQDDLPENWREELAKMYPPPQLDPVHIFTYDKLANSASVKRMYSQAAVNRRTLAAQLLTASGLPVQNQDKLYNPDRTQLYFWLDQSLTFMRPIESGVLLAESYNVAGEHAAVVMHSPSRGVDIYIRGFAEDDSAHQMSLAALEPGAPSQSPIMASPGTVGHAGPLPSPEQLFECFEGYISKLNLGSQLKPFVALTAGCTLSNGDEGTKFISLDACDASYAVLNPLQYSQSFAQYTMMTCNTVVSVLPSPVEANGLLYGVADIELRRMLLHAHPEMDHFTFPNTDEWVEKVRAISPGKAAFVFMNQDTAVVDTNDEIIAFKVPSDLLRKKAVMP